VTENEVQVTVYLTPPEIRPIGTSEYIEKWRKATPAIPGMQSVRYEDDRGGPGRGPGVTVELSHRDYRVLDAASAALAERIDEYAPVRDVDDGYEPGKPQLDFRLRDEGRSLGITAMDIARQVRGAFYGAEALRQQRGRHEIKVMVRYPENERISEYAIEEFLVRAPGGADVPLREVADLDRGRAYTTIKRRDGRRTINVTGNVRPQSETNRVLESLKADVLPDMQKEFPGLVFSFEGRQAQMREGLEALVTGFLAALIGIYVLLAIPFRSYLQPLIVMMAIPFGIIGAAAGHVLMDYSLSLISMMGIVALSGVVVNDALVMIDYANRRRRAGMTPREAVHAAGIRRFRPILLTTLTTFGGLGPMIFETSRQARFLIPMAISLGFGIVFATAITLILVPCLYMIIEDVRRAGAFLHHLFFGPPGTERSMATV
jgi:multidrug efflux pump subunit AcrB